MTPREHFKRWHRRCRITPHNFNMTRAVINGRYIGIHRVGRQTGWVVLVDQERTAFEELDHARFYRTSMWNTNQKHMVLCYIAAAHSAPGPNLGA